MASATASSGYGPGDTDVVGARIAAQIVDSVVIVVLVGVFAVGGVALGGGRAFGTLIGVVVFLGYGTLLEGAFGQTLGKMLLGIRVVDDTGTQVGYGAAFVRNVPVLFGGWLTWLVGMAAIAIDDRNQRLFDQIAGTYVTG